MNVTNVVQVKLPPFSQLDFWKADPLSESTVGEVKSTDEDPREVIRKRLNSVSIQTMREMTRDNRRRLEHYKRDPSLLDEGVFYSCEHFQAANECKEQTKRVADLVNSDHYLNGFLDPDYFQPVGDPSIKVRQCFFYIIKPNRAASDALKAAITGLSLIDCRTTLQLADYNALLKVLGKEKFDVIFDGKGKTPLSLGGAAENPIYQLYDPDCYPNLL